MVSELDWDDLLAEFDEDPEYADSRLEMDEFRLSSLVDTGDWKAAWGGGGDPTAFRGIEGIFLDRSGSLLVTGTAGRGESTCFGANLAPMLCFRGGKAATVDMLGRFRGVWLVTEGEGGSSEGGGRGRAFEKRDRPILGVCRKPVTILLLCYKLNGPAR